MSRVNRSKGTAGSRQGAWFAAAIVANAVLGLFLLVSRQENGQWRLLTALGAGAPSEEPWTREGGPDAPGPIVSVDNVNVMLRSGDQDHYVEADFALEVGSVEDKQIVHQRLSRIREVSLGFLSGLAPDQLRGSSGLEHTKETLLQTFRKVLPGQELRAVYVTKLVID